LSNGNIQWRNDLNVYWETALNTDSKLLDTTVGNCAYKNTKGGNAMYLLFDENEKLTGFKFMSDVFMIKE